MTALPKSNVESSSKSEQKTEPKKFDDFCIGELSNIFDINSKWKTIAIALGYQEFVTMWQKSRKPTKVLLKYFEVIQN